MVLDFLAVDNFDFTRKIVKIFFVYFVGFVRKKNPIAVIHSFQSCPGNKVLFELRNLTKKASQMQLFLINDFPLLTKSIFSRAAKLHSRIN